jgi:D-alanine--poly(phosphoribitol) ligase subunit 1
MNLTIDSIGESIKKFSERNAFFIHGKYYTYEKLGQKISEINNSLKPFYKDISPKHIGVMIYDDLESYASCVCILLSGYGYVPLSPLNPEDHNLEIFQQADIKIVLSSQDYKENGSKNCDSVTFLNTANLSEGASELDFPQSETEDPAYLIFTSGSTGKPKGAIIRRRNLDSFFDSVKHLGWSIGEDDKFLQMSSLTFDMSILTLLLPLCFGACIYTIPENEIKYIYGYNLMLEHGITFIAMVPSTLRYLKSYFDEILLASVRYSLICGEPFPVRLADLWQDCVPNASLLNIYGPSEATVFTHYYNYRKSINQKSYNGILAIGRIVKNMDALIIDEAGNEVQSGEKGELYISGNQLTSGYLEESRNSQKSFSIIKSGENEKRYYHTGDIVFKDSEDCYYYVGRKDNQVKIQGHRIELGEIEKHARDIIQNESVVAIAHKTFLGTQQVIIYMEEGTITKKTMLEYLKSKLPYYMIPSDIIFLRSLPLNINGKIDRLLLSEKGGRQ